MWYKSEEHAFIVAVLQMMNGGQQIVGGDLAYFFTLLYNAKLRNWKILFHVYGALTVVWGTFVLY
ncbi:CIC11C00000001308 [Sungouiella intermedia]|uniref:CIC11C00000001308 n=1 Tax=Sungouiella intermedia TaxID=45354 RepID=A0A1L0BRS8_9ASCO|nr:CIC11C00000001308 [[Candida] intermedia]